MIIGILVVVLNGGQSQKNGFVLHDDVDHLLRQTLQFSHLCMLMPSDLADHLLNRSDRFKEDLLGHLLQIPFLNGINAVLPFKLFEGVDLDGGDAFLFQLPIKKIRILFPSFLKVDQGIDESPQHPLIDGFAKDDLTDESFLPLNQEIFETVESLHRVTNPLLVHIEIVADDLQRERSFPVNEAIDHFEGFFDELDEGDIFRIVSP